MKLINQMSKNYLPSDETPKLVHAIQDVFILKYLDTPISSDQAVCPMCDGKNGYAVIIDPDASDNRMWFCAERDCLAAVARSRPKTHQTAAKAKRSLEWPLFCELNDIGDLDYGVNFEQIDQSQAKIDYLRKFSETPRGIILMEGGPGTGKTYASMALCELFTRTNPSCLFYTAKRLMQDWVESTKGDPLGKFRDKVMLPSLLIVDDFGTGEPSQKFMEFFMELINVRIQWSNRGTVITTNLNPGDFSRFCGNALSDRINMGQKFEFKTKSRRKQSIL